MSKQILVTGGLGFIGSHLCLRLLKEGHYITCLDDLSTGQVKNLHDLEQYPNFRYINWDIINPIEIEGTVDEIYNLACPASPVQYQKNPIHTNLTSVVGVLNMLELAKKKQCKILQASTSEIYGEAIEHPQKETYYGNVNTLGVRSCYDEGKRCAESLCMDYCRQFGVQVKIIRIFNTYGPRMAENDGRVVSNFITKALKGEELTIYGDGTQTRSFQYVDDLIEAMVRIVATDENFTGPVNIGNPCEITIKDLADMIIDFTKSKSCIVSSPLPQNDPKLRCPDISLATKQLDYWVPKIDIKDGLKRTIEYFNNEIQ